MQSLCVKSDQQPCCARIKYFCYKSKPWSCCEDKSLCGRLATKTAKFANHFFHMVSNNEGIVARSTHATSSFVVILVVLQEY